MNLERLEEFVRLLKHGTLLHHHGAIDRLVGAFARTGDYHQFAHDLIRETASHEVVLESVALARELRVPADPARRTKRVS